MKEKLDKAKKDAKKFWKENKKKIVWRSGPRWWSDCDRSGCVQGTQIQSGSDRHQD